MRRALVFDFLSQRDRKRMLAPGDGLKQGDADAAALQLLFRTLSNSIA